MSKEHHPLIISTSVKHTVQLNSLHKVKEVNQRGIENVIKFRRMTTHFKAPLSEEELTKLSQFILLFQSNEVSITILHEKEIQQLLEKDNFTPKYSAIIVSSLLSSPVKCIDILNRVELFCTSNEWFGYWNKGLASKYKTLHKTNSTYCLCVGHSLLRFVRYSPRPSPSIQYNY
ncbi:hypothetical protein KM1_066680 [Entamoeba histolytica HM-3:IMSS]|uniref:Uncharacterized protein n=4 Tax=Entamoeba histolytica TaxID=5759 RepID=C4M6N1_ENTH1|nr:hypothetical protein EHI_161880 [Entamoeba histolytica HM-1:IMSS]EAL43914.1 hypothetical protein EHI_161880 [Entamoeba histolytica HM-1:IMSS]EMD48836.1 Hypothetical protein EHI5A_055810 [Entamoeba histolytica KU27]EMS16739.1 hypothetical protein KM1_066680 [Entamoeba histolytica HM-3:IMSS]GAT97151.1 hypothetical protein CL6EHI_161880 [Entamoeba histolytica]|eukprot:XP_649303.1 hypothetical protein EHI_161880 [Entamoeba histolytica HM-1:IMSS]